MAAAMVVVCHLAFAGVIDAPLLMGAKNGVLLFFALSGYLLYLPFTRGPVDLRRYAIHRFFRIAPAYLVALVGVTILTGDRTFVDDPLRYVLFLQNYDAPTWQGFLGTSWTLVIEVWFYASLPLIAFVVAGRPERLLLLAGLSFLGATIGYVGADPRLLSSLPPFMLWAFVPGMLVAMAQGRAALLGHPAVLGIGIALIAGGILEPSWASMDLNTAVGSGLVVAWTVRRWTHRWAPLAAAGAAVSYSVYLWHLPLIGEFGLVGVALSLPVGAIVYVAVERSALRLGRRLASARPVIVPAQMVVPVVKPNSVM